MKQKIEEIKATCKKDVEFKYIIADFGKITTIAEYREIFGTVIENIDIGLVIANAGMGGPAKYESMTDDFLSNTMNINCLHVYYTFKILSEKLLKRDKRSCMIVTSSLAYRRPMPASVYYCA
jgi:short-subunit dehydrogenase